MFYVFKYSLGKRLRLNYDNIKTLAYASLVHNYRKRKFIKITENVDDEQKLKKDKFKKGKFLDIYYYYDDNITYVYLSELYINYVEDKISAQMCNYGKTRKIILYDKNMIIGLFN